MRTHYRGANIPDWCTMKRRIRFAPIAKRASPEANHGAASLHRSVRAIAASPLFSAAAPARCTNTGAREVFHSMRLIRSAAGTAADQGRKFFLL